MTNFKTCLRTIGGKSRAVKYILPLIPKGITRFVEPFIGGASVTLAAVQANLADEYYANDRDINLINFYRVLNDRDCNPFMRTQLLCIVGIETAEKKRLFQGAKADLYNNNLKDQSNTQRAAKYYFMNKCSFSGAGRYGGFSSHASERRFTREGINKLANYVGILDNVSFTSQDYWECLEELNLTKDDFVYLDSPYPIEGDHLYEGHKYFDYALMAQRVKTLSCKVLISYNDCAMIRELYKGWTITEYKLAHGSSRKEATELLIRNY